MEAGSEEAATLRGNLRKYLTVRLPDAAELEVGEVTWPSNGYSNETASFDASWTEEGGRRSQAFILRSLVEDSQIFYGADLFLQWDMMRLLGEHTDVPMPPLWWAERDRSALGMPFFMMSRVDGRVPQNGPSYHSAGWVAELPADQQTAVVHNGLDALARLHSLGRHSAFEFLQDGGRGQVGLDRYLGWIEDWYVWAAKGRTFPAMERALAYCREHQPRTPDVTVLWGDARVGNIVYAADNSVAAVLDWEMATLGPPEVDVAWWIMFDRILSEGMGHERLPGVPPAEGIISDYESLTGTTLTDLDYYDIVALLRLDITIIRMQAPAADDDPAPVIDNPIDRALAAQLATVGAVRA